MEVIKLDDFPINPIQDQIYEIIPDKAKIVASTNRLFTRRGIFLPFLVLQLTHIQKLARLYWTRSAVLEQLR